MKSPRPEERRTRPFRTNHVIGGNHGTRSEDEMLGTMVTDTKTIQRVQESKCRSYDDLGEPGTSDDAGGIVRYRRDGQQDAKTDMVMVIVDGLVEEDETGNRRSDGDRFVKCIETEEVAIVL
jgi:hypothetical protein